MTPTKSGVRSGKMLPMPFTIAISIPEWFGDMSIMVRMLPIPEPAFRPALIVISAMARVVWLLSRKPIPIRAAAGPQ